MTDRGVEWRAARDRLEDLDGWPGRGCEGTPVGIWFDPRVVDEVVEEYCRRCPILRECREYAIRWEPEGTLGGLSERERREIRREQRRAQGARLVRVETPAVLDGLSGAEGLGEAA